MTPAPFRAPDAVLAFDPCRVRARTFGERLSRAIGVALADADGDRNAVAAAMSARLGRRVSRPMLDAYASQAREDHAISVPRFHALLGVTGDRRLLELLAAEHGWAVIERSHLPWIELGAVRDQMDALERHAEQLRRQVRGNA